MVLVEMVVVVFAESFCCTYVAEVEIVLQALQDVAQSATTANAIRPAASL